MSTFKGTGEKMNPLFKGKILISLMMGLSVTVATVTVMSQSRLYRHTEKTLGKGQVQAIEFSPDGKLPTSNL